MMQTLYSHSHLFGGNAPFIEELYEQYLADANSVTAEWRDYFDKLQQTPGAADRDVLIILFKNPSFNSPNNLVVLRARAKWPNGTPCKNKWQC